MKRRTKRILRADSCQLSAFSDQLSAFSSQRSALSSQRSALSFLAGTARLLVAVAMLGSLVSPPAPALAAGAAAGQPFGSPQAMLTALKSAGQTPGQIAAQLAQTFNQNAQQVASLLKSAGFTPAQVAGALQSAFKASTATVASAMKGAGYTLNQVADALWSNGTPVQVATALRAAFDVPAEQLLQIMKAKKTAIADVVGVLRAVYGQTTCGVAACPAATLLKQAGYRAAEVVGGLKQAYSLNADAAARILETVFGLGGAALEAALEAAGYTAAQIAAALNAAGDAAATTAAGTIDLAGIVHGSHRSCSFPSTRVFGVGGGTQPLPLPGGPSVTVSFVGRQMLLVTAITGLPAGARATIRERHDCFLLADVTVPASTRAGMQGQATLQVGQAAGPRFVWAIGPVPPPLGSGPVTPIGRGSNAGGVARPPAGAAGAPDLVADFVGPVLRHIGPGSRRVSDAFCEGLPSPLAGQASIAEITVPGFRWGVINSSNHRVDTAFRIELANNATQQVLRTVDVPGGRLVPGTQGLLQDYVRPQSRTRVIRVTATSSAAIRSQYGPSGCFQLLMAPGDPLNWQDPPFRVRVDVANAVNEGADGEINNTNVY